MSEFSSSVELMVRPDSSSLRTARSEIEDAVGDVSVDVSTTGASSRMGRGGGGGTRLAGKERAMSRQLLTDQTARLGTIVDHLARGIELSEIRNDLLREMIGETESGNFTFARGAGLGFLARGAGLGGLLGNAGLLGASVVGGIGNELSSDWLAENTALGESEVFKRLGTRAFWNPVTASLAAGEVGLSQIENLELPESITEFEWPSVPGVSASLANFDWPDAPGISASVENFDWPAVPGPPASLENFEWPSVPGISASIANFEWPKLEAPGWVQKLFGLSDREPFTTPSNETFVPGATPTPSSPGSGGRPSGPIAAQSPFGTPGHQPWAQPRPRPRPDRSESETARDRRNHRTQMQVEFSPTVELGDLGSELDRRFKRMKRDLFREIEREIRR